MNSGFGNRNSNWIAIMTAWHWIVATVPGGRRSGSTKRRSGVIVQKYGDSGQTSRETARDDGSTASFTNHSRVPL